MSKTATKRSPDGTTKAGGTILLSEAEKLLGLRVADARERHSWLTPRETEVATLMATGQKNRQIAQELGISPKTLDIHRANLMHKLRARTTVDVANFVHVLRFAERAAVHGG